MSDLFLINVKLNVTAVVVASSINASQIDPDKKSHAKLEEGRRYIAVQNEVQVCRRKMLEAKTEGRFEELERLNLQVRQLLLDNPTPGWIVQNRRQCLAENRSMANGNLNVHEARVNVQLYIENCRMDEAKHLQMKIVEAQKMGGNISELSQSLMQLSDILRAQGDLDGAKAVCIEVVDMRKRLYGENHPETLQVMGIYVGILIEMRKLNEAETLLSVWFIDSQRLLGRKHPQTVSCNLVLQYFRRAHEIIRSGRLPAGSQLSPAGNTVFAESEFGKSKSDSCEEVALETTSVLNCFKEGMHVCIEGLRSNPELNGRTGTIRGAYNETNGRWTIQLDGADANRLVSIRFSNIKVISETDPEIIKRLCDCGYARLHVLQCLAASKSDPDAAREYLVNGFPEQLQKEYVYGHLISKMWTQWSISFGASAEARRLPQRLASVSTPSYAAPLIPSNIAVPLCFDRNTQWVCDEGVVRSKVVDYCAQCPKGTALIATSFLEHGCFACSDQHTVSGLKCNSCCSYGICLKCILKLQNSHATSFASTDFPILGVGLTFLKAFRVRWGAVYNRWSTSQVVKMLIKPLTGVSRKSICDNLIETQSSDVGKATVFLSHVWNQSFSDTLDAFIEIADSWPHNDGVFVWMDVFSVSQHASPDELSSSWWMNAFKQAISQFGRLVMVMQPWEKPIALTRGWCMLELFSCVSTGGRFEIALPPSERLRFFQRDFSSRASFFQSLPELMNSKQAQFSRTEDKVRDFVFIVQHYRESHGLFQGQDSG
jgi:hypothetical protein